MAKSPKSLVYDVPEAGALLGLSRNASYEAAKRGDLPTIRVGKLLKVPKAALESLLQRTWSTDAKPSRDQK